MYDTKSLVDNTFVARIEHHATIDSTNARAKQCASQGPGPLPLLILADSQTAGRGRGSNRWWTGRGSLALSILFDPGSLKIDQRSRPLIALASGVAVTRTVAPLLPGQTVGIHWPNDVMAAGRKLTGILVEALAGGLCVVGIGLNTNNRLDEAPPELRETATTLFDLTGADVDQAAVLETLLNELATAFRSLGEEPERVAAEANRMCLQHGRTVEIDPGGGSVKGRCAGIAPDGALLIDTPEGRRPVYSGVPQ